MRDLKQLLDDPFFDLLESGAEEARRSLRLLGGFLETKSQDLSAFSASKRDSERIAAEIDARLAKTIKASLRKEDIQALSRGLRRIPESVERLAERFHLAKDQAGGLEFTRLAPLIERAASGLVSIVSQLRGDGDITQTKRTHAQVQAASEEVEDLTEALLQDCYRRESDPVRIVAAKDLLERVQGILQRCCECAELVDGIVLTYC
jgi:uncharacterized protein